MPSFINHDCSLQGMYEQEAFEILDYAVDLQDVSQANECRAHISNCIEAEDLGMLLNSENERRKSIHPSAQKIEHGHIAFSTLLERCEGEMELVDEVFGAFFLQGEESCTQIKKSLEAGEMDKVQFQAVRKDVNCCVYATHSYHV